MRSLSRPLETVVHIIRSDMLLKYRNINMHLGFFFSETSNVRVVKGGIAFLINLLDYRGSDTRESGGCTEARYVAGGAANDMEST